MRERGNEVPTWVKWMARGVAMCLAGVSLGWGQPSESGGGEGEAPAQAPASLTPVFGTLGTFNGEVQLQLEKFGVGNVARAGDWCGIRLKMLDSSAKQRNVVVRLMSADSDGDHPIYERSLTLNPGVWQGVWMYTRLPFAIDPARDMVASVYEGIDDEGSATGLSAGKLLGRMALSPRAAKLVTPGLGMFGLVGTGRYGLKGYAMPPTGEHFGYYTHEAYEMVDGLTPGDLPDHYAGLSALEFVVWASGEPSELRAERAAALRHWIARGGHLVVILPAVGQSWTSDVSNELFDLLPAVTIQRREGVDLTEYRPILNYDSDAPLPTKDAVVHVFTPKADARAHEAMAILNGPDGACVVVRRLVGLGAVTLVGLDLSRTVFSQGQSIDPQVFWHRVLGKRGEIPSVKDPNSLLTIASRSVYPVDADIAFEIAKTGHSAIGVSLGFIIFGLYWLVAGPLGYAALKRGGQTKHAWVGFVVVGMVFTAIAWGGATLIRPGRVEGSHLTFLDHVYGQDVQRARSWMGLLLPSYGTTRISVGDPEAAKFDSMAGSTANLITPWEPLSDAGRSAWVSFPDARNYTIDARRYDAIEVPTRATVKQFQADWAGGPRWKMPYPVEEIKINENAGPQQPQMTGTLRHDLPAALSEVVVIHVQPELTPAVARASTEPGVKGQRPPEMTARGWVYRYQGKWLPGEEFDLGVLTLLGGQSRTALTTYLDGFLPASSMFGFGDENAPDASKSISRFYAAALFDYLTPIDPNAAGRTRDVAARRTSMHGWSLGRWFTQPCIIVLAQVGERADGKGATEMPMPVYVDGELLKAKGRTVLRWIYPLAAEPPRVPKKEEVGEVWTPGK